MRWSAAPAENSNPVSTRCCRCISGLALLRFDSFGRPECPAANTCGQFRGDTSINQRHQQKRNAGCQSGLYHEWGRVERRAAGGYFLLDAKALLETGGDQGGAALALPSVTTKSRIFAVGDIRSGAVGRVASGVVEEPVLTQAVHQSRGSGVAWHEPCRSSSDAVIGPCDRPEA